MVGGNVAVVAVAAVLELRELDRGREDQRCQVRQVRHHAVVAATVGGGEGNGLILREEVVGDQEMGPSPSEKLVRLRSHPEDA